MSKNCEPHVARGSGPDLWQNYKYCNLWPVAPLECGVSGRFRFPIRITVEGHGTVRTYSSQYAVRQADTLRL